MKNPFGKITNLISAFLLIYISFSCVSTKSLLIEIPYKSNKELPENIQSLLLVARMVDDSYTNLAADSLQRIFYKQQFNYDTVINNIQTIDTTLKALGELLYESGRYDIVIPENRFLDFEKNAFITKELSWEEAKMLCETYNTDAVLSIDHFKTRVMTSYDKEEYFVPSMSHFQTVSEAAIKVSFETVIRVYDPDNEKILSRMILRDTLIWSDIGTSAGEIFSRFTSIKEALAEVGIAAALEFSDQINPVWKRERRGYFATGDSNLKQADLLVKSGQWGAAIALWKETAEKSKSKSLKSKAEFNIALGYEMLGDIDSSILWALKSYETMYRTNTYSYLEVLKRRKNEINNQQP